MKLRDPKAPKDENTSQYYGGSILEESQRQYEAQSTGKSVGKSVNVTGESAVDNQIYYSQSSSDVGALNSDEDEIDDLYYN